MVDQSPYKIGLLVIHPNKPEWGPGKIVMIKPGGILCVVWRDLSDRKAMRIQTKAVPLSRAPEQSDPILDNLPPLLEEGEDLVLPRERILFKDAMQEFLGRFPGGFYDEAYIGNSTDGERAYKLQAHQYALEHLGGQQFRSLLNEDCSKLVKEVERTISKVNLLFRIEQMALHDALGDEIAARIFLTTLADLLDAEEITEDVFTPYVKSVCDLPAERGKVASWPVATILPFLMQPERHMFLKPNVTQEAAEALGFNLNYQATPNWLTYSRLLEMARIYKEKLASLKPRDMIDVQSFFWVACGGYR